MGLDPQVPPTIARPKLRRKFQVLNERHVVVTGPIVMDAVNPSSNYLHLGFMEIDAGVYCASVASTASESGLAGLSVRRRKDNSKVRWDC